MNSNVLESIDAKEYDDMYIGFEYSFSVVDLNEGNENVYRDEAVTSENGANDRIVIFDNGKMIIPEEDETDNIAE